MSRTGFEPAAHGLKVRCSRLLGGSPFPKIQNMREMGFEPTRLECIGLITQLEIQLAKLAEEEELANQGQYGRLVLTFHREASRNQWQARAQFTGEVGNRNDQSGRTTYTNREAIFAVNNRSYAMPENDGETWICTIGFQIAMAGGRPVIVVNPQVRVDNKTELEADLAQWQAELEKLRANGSGGVVEAEEEAEPLSDAELAVQVEALRTRFGH
ncbi:hypothetical protein COT52_01320 [candidate division WWE3 bacterium CG08_land_8_20_14_0_20_43_13]|uniref:Uncharacterized protein n=1 Tax=candidate division WWE3 bacterium CG08_land_8_20_14_0_20_43_13 TaxID=1975087 RepID=A0A2H0X7U5_UNCKA|nr:MAG: hypothetical protein COT52_01320 [candidate division WWE3 bacterium CG08_land_8_20_14_0_20_43_13]